MNLIMGERMMVYLVLVFNYFLVAFAESANEDLNALRTLMSTLNTPQSWVGSDPCNGWEGIKCTNSRVTSILLSGMDLTGQLPGDIGLLSELQILDLSFNKNIIGPLPPEIGNLKKLSDLSLNGCGFTGAIPDEIGSLQELAFLALNSNNFIGRIPPSIGKLSKLEWLDLTYNQLDGPIPVSSGTTPGLDMLLKTKHFHLGNNKLSGEIPSKLFCPEMALIHLILNGNQLTGNIPYTLGLVQNLEVVRLENNSLSGTVPQNLRNLLNVTDLILSNNKLQGPLPNLSRMNHNLAYLDMSNNNFDPSDFPSWLLTLNSLKTLMMERTQLQGQIPFPFFSLANLQTVVLKNNKLNGTLDIGTTYSKRLQLIDLQNNAIDYFKQQGENTGVTIILFHNTVCYETGTSCSIPNMSYANHPMNCLPATCNIPYQILSPKCKCSIPFTGTLSFRAPSYMDWKNKSPLEEDLLNNFQSAHLPVDSVSVSNPPYYPFQDLEFIIQVFPSGKDGFNRTEISSISLLLNNMSRNQAYTFLPDPDNYEVLQRSSKSSNMHVIIGATVGGFVLLVLLLLAGVYAFCQRKRAERAIGQSNPFGHWDLNDNNSPKPQLHGARHFFLEELKKYTNNFSQDNDIGSGGYGKVYRGTLPKGQLIAIKRAQKQSKQRGLQFKAEIELLSRVHHKNLVSLVGFCFERGEQMLVYEFIPNGSLKDSLSGKSGIILDWTRRLKVALGAARGLAYLHEHASPPIIHRDIKSNNILLDAHLNAKVADFGLSKPMDDCEKDHVTTQVKGTMGYLDPDYYTSQQLTEKSDVYSFGVLMLELITARKPIEKGKHIVKVVRNAVDKTKDLYGLHEILDPAIGSRTTLMGFEKFLDLAMKCVEDSGADRPTMNDVVREIESILQSVGLNPTAESSASNSATHEEICCVKSQDLYSN